MILALDMATKCGWALQSERLTTTDTVVSGVAQFGKRARDGDGDRLLRFFTWLSGIAAYYGTPSRVVYEQAHGGYRGRQAQHLAAQYEAVLLLWCARADVQVSGVSQNTLKKLAGGHAWVEKSAVIAAVRSLGFKPQDDNEADAIALLLTHTGALRAEPIAAPPEVLAKRRRRSDAKKQKMVAAGETAVTDKPF